MALVARTANLPLIVTDLVVAFLILVFVKAQSYRRLRYSRTGGILSIQASLKGTGPPYPPEWRRGTVTIGQMPMVWQSIGGRTDIAIPPRFLITEQRHPQGTPELRRLNRSSIVTECMTSDGLVFAIACSRTDSIILYDALVEQRLAPVDAGAATLNPAANGGQIGPGSAIELPPTLRAMHFQGRAAMAVIITSILALCAFVILNASHNAAARDDTYDFFAAVIFLGLLSILIASGGAVLVALRTRTTLRRHPWTTWNALCRMISGSRAIAVLLDDAHGGQHWFTVSTMMVRRRFRALSPIHGGIAWFAGDPRKRGILAIDPAGPYYYVSKPAFGPARRSLEKKVRQAFSVDVASSADPRRIEDGTPPMDTS